MKFVLSGKGAIVVGALLGLGLIVTIIAKIAGVL